MMKVNKTILFTIATSIFIAVGLYACSGEDKLHTLRVKLTNIKHTREKIGQKSLVEEITIPSPVIYGGLIKHFDTSPDIMINPLQAFPLSQLKFIGTVYQNHELLAYIFTPDGKTFPAKKGDIIGDEYGRITNIDVSKVEVTQQELGKGKKPINKIVIMQPKE